jgi:hypothetical protein
MYAKIHVTPNEVQHWEWPVDRKLKHLIPIVEK